MLEPLAPKFLSDLSVHLMDIAEKGVTQKLKPIVIIHQRDQMTSSQLMRRPHLEMLCFCVHPIPGTVLGCTAGAISMALVEHADKLSFLANFLEGRYPLEERMPGLLCS